MPAAAVPVFSTSTELPDGPAPQLEPVPSGRSRTRPSRQARSADRSPGRHRAAAAAAPATSPHRRQRPARAGRWEHSSSVTPTRQTSHIVHDVGQQPGGLPASTARTRHRRARTEDRHNRARASSSSLCPAVAVVGLALARSWLAWAWSSSPLARALVGAGVPEWVWAGFWALASFVDVQGRGAVDAASGGRAQRFWTGW